MTKLDLSPERRAELVVRLQAYFSDEFDEPLSAFRAEELLTFMLKELGPSLYNAGIQDARAFLSDKLDDLDIEFSLDEGT
ncbi:DUF2164 domain-containing protein [Ahrensia marina]|uniref:DUF2164 domain-containing protein n=1 Tax=Ahrensia marina TaxID=1514904 RepID=UPI0035D06AF3